MDSGVKTKAYYWIFFVVVTVCLSTAAYALYQETGVPSIPFEENEATGLDAHIEASIDVAGLQVVLEKTSLLDIQKKQAGSLDIREMREEACISFAIIQNIIPFPYKYGFFLENLGEKIISSMGCMYRKGLISRI